MFHRAQCVCSLDDLSTSKTFGFPRYSPIGVCFLVAAKLAGTPDLGNLMISLGFYMLTVLLGLFIHGLIVIPLIYLIFVRKNPFKYIWGVIQAIVTAFATASR